MPVSPEAPIILRLGDTRQVNGRVPGVKGAKMMGQGLPSSGDGGGNRRRNPIEPMKRFLMEFCITFLAALAAKLIWKYYFGG